MAWILPDSVVADVASLPVTPLDGFEATVAGNSVRYSTATAKWVPTAPRRLTQLPYDALVDDVEVFVTNVRCPDGKKFAKYEGHWIDPALPLECPTCGQSQIVDPATGGTRHVINTAAELDALKTAASIAAGDVVHLRHPDGGTGAQIVGYFDMRGDLFSGRANPMVGGTPGKPVRFTADPDVLMGGTAANPTIDVGEVAHVWVENVKVVGGFDNIRYQGVKGTAEHPTVIGHVECSLSDGSAHIAWQSFTGDIGTWSEYGRILCPKVGPADVGALNPQELEGLYLGKGSTATIGQDKSHDLEIINPQFVGMTTDSIEFKRGVTDITVLGGRSKDTTYLPAGPNGGAGQGVLGILEPGVNYATDVDDANILIDGFEVDGYDDLYAAAIGQGGVTVRNLKVSNATGAAAALASVRVRSVAPYGIGADGSSPIVIENVSSDAVTPVQVFDPEDQNPVVIVRGAAPKYLSTDSYSGRHTLSVVDTWYGMNEQWGLNNEVWSDDSGTGATPDISNQNDRTSIMIPPGAVVERIHYWYRINNADVTDFEVAFGLLTAINSDSWDAGLNNVNLLEWRPVYQSLRSAFPTANTNANNLVYRTTFECGVMNRSALAADLTCHARKLAGGNRNLFLGFTVETSLP